MYFQDLTDNKFRGRYNSSSFLLTKNKQYDIMQLKGGIKMKNRERRPRTHLHEWLKILEQDEETQKERKKWKKIKHKYCSKYRYEYI